MTRMQRPTASRRTLLSTIGTGLAASLIGSGATATQAESQYVLVQGDNCVPVRPIRGEDPADAFYEYQLPEQYVSEDNGAVAGGSATYASAGTRDLQRDGTSIAFLYRGPDGLSLVFVHGSVENDDAGSVTFELSGLPEDGEWVVRDDYYRDPETGDIASTNYDRWDVEGTDHRVDWTWGSSGTDGGVFRALGDDVDVTIDPAFNEASPLYDEYYEGTVTDWEFLSGTDGDDVERVSLDLEEPIRIATGTCEDVSTPTETDRRTEQPETEREETKQEETDTPRETEQETDERTDQQVEQEQDIDVEQDQEIEADGEVETEQTQEVEREQTQEIETEREQRTETESEEESEEEEERDEENESSEGRGNGRKKGHENGGGEANGHEKGRGEGHDRGRGRGHEKHGEDEDEDE